MFGELLRKLSSRQIEFVTKHKGRAEVIRSITTVLKGYPNIYNFLLCLSEALIEIAKQHEADSTTYENGITITFGNDHERHGLSVEIELFKLAFEQLVLSKPDAESIRSVLNASVDGYGLRIGDLSYYVREYDNACNHYNPAGYDAKKHELACSLYRAYLDYFLISDLLEEASTKVPIKSLIVTSTGLTEIVAPNDSIQIAKLAEIFTRLKNEVLLEFDAANYLAEYGIEEPNFLFVQRLLRDLNMKLPPDFKIMVHEH